MSREECQIFAKRLKQLRTAAGLTQEMLAKLLNISRSCLANYESCNRVANEDIVQDVARYFDVSVSYLLGRQRRTSSKTRKYMREFSEILLKDSLDISDFSSSSRIALYEFYCFLTAKSRHDEENEERYSLSQDE